MLKYQRLLRILILVIFSYSMGIFFYQSALKHNTRNMCKSKYKQSCLDLYKSLRTINKSLVFSPPTDKIPDELLEKFTQFGDMPITNNAYINEAFDETNPYFGLMQKKISKSEINDWRKKVQGDAALGYNTVLFEKIFRELSGSSQIKNGNMIVFGTQSPWIEALGLEMKAKNVITVDFAKKEYEDENLKWYQILEFLEFSIRNEVFQQFDTISSYSFLEHIGLGRYGEQLSPDGDVDTLEQIHCLLKPDSLLFLGLQTSENLNNSYLEFNYQRVYGAKRLAKLFGSLPQKWEVLLTERENHNSHSLFVLKSVDLCA